MARRRLELMSAELAEARSVPGDPPPPAGTDGPGELDIESALPVDTAAGPARMGGGHGRHAYRPVEPVLRAGGWLEDRLPPSLQGRVRLGAAHLAALCVVTAISALVLTWSVVRAHDPGDLAPARAEVAPSAGRQTPLATPAADALGAPVGTPTDGVSGELVVDVAGKVHRPGIVRLPAGSRVVDALEAAGGARRGVDLTPLNLARLLVDGEQILVGVVPTPGLAASAAAGGTPAGPLVNINSAAQAELETLPGVGPVTATKILQWRAEHGAFSSVDELLEVSGIGEATLAEIAPYVTL